MQRYSVIDTFNHLQLSHYWKSSYCIKYFLYVVGVKSTEPECRLSCGFATRIDVSARVDVDVKGGTGRLDIPPLQSVQHV